MEIIMMMCLMVIIVLLLQDKIYLKKKVTQRDIEGKKHPYFPEIMGQSKSTKNLMVSNGIRKTPIQKPEINPHNLDIEYKGNENPYIQNLQKEQKKVLGSQPDFEEEEEEWKKYRIASHGNSLAQGVTFEELCTVGIDLHKDNLAPSQKETTSATIQKIHGTALFNLLENSIEDSSCKIAELLDNSFKIENEISSSILRKEDFENFDIEEFI